MADITQLRVSLTKNGYLKISELVKRFPRWEVLDNVRDSVPGVNLIRSQVANIMGEDLSGELPGFWDAIRAYEDETIDAFVFVAIVFSHVDLIQLLRASTQGEMRGFIRRADVPTEKTYTNLVYAMAGVNACDYVRGSEATNYDLRSVVYHLSEAHEELRALIEFKLRRCGWRTPDRPGGTEFFAECREHGFHEVFGLTPQKFRRWIEGTLAIDPPVDPRAPRPERPR